MPVQNRCKSDAFWLLSTKMLWRFIGDFLPTRKLRALTHLLHRPATQLVMFCLQRCAQPHPDLIGKANLPVDGAA